MSTDNKLADYVLVPRVPTEAMFDAGVERHRPQNMSAARLRLIWDAMLSAAPGQPPANGDVEALADLELAARYPHIKCAKYADLLDFHFAVDGSGPLANEWMDKPHRLVYRLTGMLSDLRDARLMTKGRPMTDRPSDPDDAADS